MEPVYTLQDVDGSITRVQQALAVISREAPLAKNSMYWRTQAENNAVALMKEALDAIDEAQTSVKLVQATNKVELASRFEAVFGAEQKAFLVKHQISLLTSMTNRRFPALYQTMREMTVTLNQIAASRDDADEKVRRLGEVLVVCNQALDEYQSCEESMEMYALFKAAHARLGLEGEQAMGQLRVADEKLADLKVNIAPIVQTAFWMCPGPSEEEKNALSAIKQYDDEFYFWRNAPTGSRVGYYVGRYYPETGQHGVAMEENIGKRIVALRKELDTRINKLLTKELNPERLERLTKRLDAYVHYITALGQDVEGAFTALCQKPNDALHETLCNYVHGLRFSLIEISQALHVAKQLSTPFACMVARGRRLLASYLLPAKAANSVEEGFNEVESLYNLGLQLKVIAATDNTMRDGDAKSYVVALASRVQEIYQKHGQESLLLDADEAAVFDFVMQGGGVERFYAKGEQRIYLPKRVQTVLMKWATEALFIHGDDFINTRLELLLRTLDTTKVYKLTYQGQHRFERVITEYNRLHAAFRREELLTEANGILQEIYKALKQKPNIFAYVAIMHRLFAFSQMKIEEKGIELRRNAFVAFLYGELEELADSYNYVRLYDKAVARPASWWSTEEGEGYTVLTALDVASKDPEEKKKLFISFCLHFLAVSLYENGHEQESARRHVRNILELDGYKEYREEFANYPYIERLIAENTANTVIDASWVIGGNERSLFLNKPVKELLEQESQPAECSKMQHALFLLILEEEKRSHGKQPFKERFIAAKGEEAFTLWMKSYRTFLVSSLDHATIESLAAKPSHELIGRLGKLEAEKVTQVAKAVLLYTDRLRVH